jgi:alkylhydroperoxidase/carboxymuconolactone decarboxylase family protein YurZ
MSDMAQKAEALIERMKKDRGYIYPEWEFAARANPDFVEAYNNLYRLALGDGAALSAKTREFIAIGILAYRGEVAAIKTHILRALRLGATRQEILEAVETSLVPGGAPTYFHGLQAIVQAFAEAEDSSTESR